MSHLSCVVLTSCVFYLWAFVYSAPAGWKSEADVKPDDPIFEEGETIVLNCTLYGKLSQTYNARWLAFRHNRKIYGPDYVTVLSEDTAQLRLPNATVDHYGHFNCYMPNRNPGVYASQYVTVARRPMKPVLEDCRVHNWEFLECSWSPSKEKQITYSFSSKLQSEVFWHIQKFESPTCQNLSEENNFILQRIDTSPNFGNCSGFEMGQSYCFQVQVTNGLLKPVRSDEVCFKTSDIVWPNPPEVVKGALLDDGKSTMVQWDPPSSSFSYDPLQLTYVLDYKSQCDQQTMSITELNATTNVTLPGNPYTTYAVWLRVKPLTSGFWSNATTFQFRTPKQALYQQPVLNPRGFSIHSHDGVNRDVMIYWKPMPRERFSGPNFRYIASVKSSGVWETLNNQKNNTGVFVEIQLKPEATDVRIVAENEVGNCTAPQEPVRIPSFSSGLPVISPVYEVVVELDMKNYSYALIHWTYTSERTNVTGATIFWCSSSLPFTDFAHCKPNIEWKELNLSQLHYSFTFDDNLYPIEERDKLRAGISVDVNFIPCGIKWSTSIYAMNKVAPPPKNIQAVIPYGSDHGYVYVTWEKPECVMRLSCGYADQFLLVYCLVSSADSEACVDKNDRVAISSRTFAYNLTGLHIGSNYKLWMLSQSNAGFSAESNAVYTATSEPWKTPGAIVGIAFALLIILIVVVFGFYGTFRSYSKYKKKFTRGVEVVMPKSVSVQRIQLKKKKAKLLNFV